MTEATAKDEAETSLPMPSTSLDQTIQLALSLSGLNMKASRQKRKLQICWERGSQAQCAEAAALRII